MPITGQELRQTTQPQWLPSKPQTWRELKRQRVEMQDLDYSCGAAALATLLREFYGVETSEVRVLQRMQKQTAASLADLAKVADIYGFRAVGYWLPLSDLLKLKIPALVHLVYRSEGHFSVVQGIRTDGLVALADPSWGNQKLLPHQFEELWDTDGTGGGKVLLIIPKHRGRTMRGDFFSPPSGAVSAYEGLRFIRPSNDP